MIKPHPPVFHIPVVRSLGVFSAFSVFVNLVLLLCVSGGCDKKPEREAEDFRFVDRADIKTLDLNRMSYMTDFRVTFALREGLYTFDPATSQPVPALAVSRQASDDKRTWTFKLRPDAKWSNGDRVVAGDFVFSWRLLLQRPGQYTYLLHYITGAADYEKAYQADSAASFDHVGVTALDDHTLQVRLDNPVTFFEGLMAFPTFYPRHAPSMESFKKVDATGHVSYDESYTRPPGLVTNGPFVLTEYVAGERLTMKKNPTYWDASAVALKGVQMLVNKDPQSAFIQYEQRKIDWIADISQEIAYPLKQRNRQDLRVSPAFGTAFLTLNCAESVADAPGVKNPLADGRVRTALSMAIDRAGLVNTVTRMGETPATHYMPPGYFEGYAAAPIATGTADEARRLLAEAGYPNGEGFPPLTILYNGENAIRRDIAANLTSRFREVLNISIAGRGVESKTYSDSLTQKQYSLGLASWYGDYLDPSTFMDKYLSNSENNDSNWGPPEFDRLVANSRKESDENKRFALLAGAESMINEQLPIIPLYTYMNLSMRRDRVKGLDVSALNHTLLKNVSISP